MKEKSVAQLRMQKKIQQLLQNTFIEADLSLNNRKFSLTISEVDISPDFRNLKIFMKLPDFFLEKDKNNFIKKMNKEGIFSIKNILAKNINFKYIPDPIFKIDNSEEKVKRVEEILANNI
ncbi:MAG: ribosome-binding factor A [Rickettsiales bacterium]|jgi:ribosome-binding factor A|nr:ribosome-binding factor A [Rickettsiales bacterium]